MVRDMDLTLAARLGVDLESPPGVTVVRDLLARDEIVVGVVGPVAEVIIGAGLAIGDREGSAGWDHDGGEGHETGGGELHCNPSGVSIGVETRQGNVSSAVSMNTY